MSNSSLHVTDAELAVLEVLWAEGPQTVRGITDVLYPDGATSDYSTVKKLLERLEAKGCICRDRSAAAHTFAAAIERDELIGERLRAVAEKLCDGSLAPLLMHLVKSQRLTDVEQQALRDLIEGADDSPRRGKSKSR